MCSKSAQNPKYQSELFHTLFSKSPDIAISLSYSLVGASALGALGRRFESCRPDHLKPSHTRELPKLSFFMFMSQSEKGEL